GPWDGPLGLVVGTGSPGSQRRREARLDPVLCYAAPAMAQQPPSTPPDAPSGLSETTIGGLYALFAYLLWGINPLFWKELVHID
ncbi:hypothetical protein, partial [Klebsiella pneumoniae]|uniref:hypothetical protein n=1 Tax=Klebsiella pneumoniae TaxID=573 RepID=UPI00194ECD91